MRLTHTRPPGRSTGWVVAALIGASAPGAAYAQDHALSEVAGIWNVEMESLSQRPTRGVRNVLVRVTEVDGELSASITNLRNEFTPAHDFRYDADSKRMQVWYGVYHYNVLVEESRLVGSVTSPAGERAVRGIRQAADDLRYGGPEVEPFETTRVGVIGHLDMLQPPDTAADPAGWVRERVGSYEEWALIVARGRIAIGFSNAGDFEPELQEAAGQEVDLHGVWVGERMRIVRIVPASGVDHTH